MNGVIWWIRRDFRLSDNTALHAALATGKPIVPVFILNDQLLGNARLKGHRISFMYDALRALAEDLRQRGSRLIVAQGEAPAILSALCQQHGLAAVYFNRDYSPYSQKRDQAVKVALHAKGVEVYGYKDLILHEANEITTRNGKPYEVFTPFSKAWDALPKPQPWPDPPQHIAPPPAEIPSLPIPIAEGAPQPAVMAGEKHAHDRLAAFLAQGIAGYATGRDQMGENGTSIISPYLRWGMISPRQCYWAARQEAERAASKPVREGAFKWINELIWREFNYGLIQNFPHMLKKNFRAVYDALPWENNPDFFAAWCEGRTGYPIVDAAMHQLVQSGWMHNRARMITASFLCKDLLIDWRLGEAFFMQHLLDGDSAQNVGGWQWTAGTGTDAAPYFRVFNPYTQSEKFDPQGVYIKRWLPVLAKVPLKYLHAPHTMPTAIQQQAGVILGRDYPLPMVDHAEQRVLALAMYEKARGQAYEAKP
jgi:deoxyribodipyrimidine photo-lyase